MDLKDIVSITGLGGLFKVEGQRNNGVIAKALGEDQSRFIPTRNHALTPLDNITIYDGGDGTLLIDAFIEMNKQEATNVVPDSKADDKVLSEYLGKIVPKYDREKVYMSDIRKLIRWYHILDALKLVDTEKPKEAEKTEVAGEKKQADEAKHSEPPVKEQTHKKVVKGTKLRKKV